MPEAPDVSARNPDSLAAVQVQVEPVATSTTPVDAGHSTSRCSGVTVYAQGTAAVTGALRDPSPPSTAAATWYA